MEWLFKRKRIIAIVSGLLFSGFILTSVLSYITSKKSIKQTIAFEKLPLTSDNIYSEVQKELLNLINTAALMASDTFVREWLTNGEAGTENIQRYLKQIKTDNNTHTSFLISDFTGNYYYYNGILKTVSPTAYRDIWYFRLKESPKLYEINVDPDLASSDTLTIFINYKVFDFTGNFIGITGIGINIFNLQDKMKNYQKKFNSHVFFTDDKGKVVLSGTDIINRGDRVSLNKDLIAVGQPISNNESETLTIRYKGKKAYVYKRFLPELNWNIIVLEMEEKSVGIFNRNLAVQAFILMAVSFAIVILILLTFMNHEKNLRELASRDSLTGAYNRLTFDILLKEKLKEIKRHKIIYSLVFFDLDHFKKVNDTYSHPAGDKVIQETVMLVSEIIRETDTLCRWGGEEFTILLKMCSLPDAERVAEKIRCAVEKHPFLWQDQRIRVTVSLGVCQFQQEESSEELLARADKALFRAKNAGRNRVSTL